LEGSHNMTTTLAELLGQHVHRAHSSVNRLAKLSGVPQRTIANWLNGVILKPRHWQDVVRIAAVLHLSETETNALLQSAGQPLLSQLRAKAATEADRALLAHFQSPVLSISQSPFQAIADLPTFVGRTRELDAAKRALLHDGRAAICGLKGMGGVGKTSLAAHLAYQLRHHFPDGILWARLDTSDTLSILAAFADAYGKDISQHQDIDSRAAVVRALLADKRVLLVLDNAQSSAEIRPLLPPTTGKPAVLITSRHHLEVSDGWARLDVEPFAAHSGDTLALFTRFLGHSRTETERETLLEIGQLLGHLPLALAITAGKLADAPEMTAATYAALLRQNETRLSQLTREDRSIRLSFDASYALLPPELQQFFAALGVFSGEDFSPEAAAYVAEISPEQAENWLQQLYRLSLVQEGRHGPQPLPVRRYRLHPLLRDYAREKLAASPDEGQNGYNRMSHFYIQQLSSLKNQYAALSLEMDNILAVLATAVTRQTSHWLIEGFIVSADILMERGLYPTLRYYGQLALPAARATHPDRLAALLFPICRLEMTAGNRAQARLYAEEGLAQAQNRGNRDLVAQFLLCLAQIEWFNGDQQEAQRYLAQCEPVAREMKMQLLLLRIKHMQSTAALTQNNFSLAGQLLQEVLQIAHAENQAIFMINGTIGLGLVAQRQGHFPEAATHYQAAITLEEDLFQTRSFTAFQLLGTNALAWGQYEAAEQHLQEALALAKQDEHLRGMAAVLRDAGDVAQARGNEAETFRRWSQALHYAQQAGLDSLLSEILCRLGEWHFRHGETAVAETTWRDALNHAQTIQSNEQTAKAQFGLARVSAANGQTQQALQTARQSLSLFESIGHRRTAEVRQWLAQLEVIQ
jgi:tetratricopeptide (TPR) repeat protein/transcriptional regulator with XRE-family HTH domain